jgi:hypothetical protein
VELNSNRSKPSARSPSSIESVSFNVFLPPSSKFLLFSESALRFSKTVGGKQSKLSNLEREERKKRESQNQVRERTRKRERERAREEPEGEEDSGTLKRFSRDCHTTPTALECRSHQAINQSARLVLQICSRNPSRSGLQVRRNC